MARPVTLRRASQALEGRAGLDHVGAAGQRIGREAAGRERARDGVVVVQRVEQVVEIGRAHV